MAATVRLGEDDIFVAKEAAKLNNRSTAGQIAHWMKIGRIIEQSPSYDHERVTSAIKAELAFDDLTMDEQEVFFDSFHAAMRAPSETDEAAFLAEIEAVTEPTTIGLFDNAVMNRFADAMRDKSFHNEAIAGAWIKDIKGLGLINRQGERGFTLLMWAVLCDRNRFVKKLIASGANPSVADDAGNTVYHIAARMASSEMLDILLRGAGFHARLGLPNFKTGVTPLMEAVLAERSENVDLLLKSNAGIDSRDKAGNTALHFALGYTRAELAMRLLKAGANPTLANKGGVSFIDLFRDEDLSSANAAFKSAYKQIEAFLLERPKRRAMQSLADEEKAQRKAQAKDASGGWSQTSGRNKKTGAHVVRSDTLGPYGKGKSSGRFVQTDPQSPKPAPRSDKFKTK